jgi:hypothetical protein
MNTPQVVPESITPAEKETAILLLKDLTVKQVQDITHLSFNGVQSRTKRIRLKTQTSTIHGALGRMLADGIITAEELKLRLTEDLPEK